MRMNLKLWKFNKHMFMKTDTLVSLQLPLCCLCSQLLFLFVFIFGISAAYEILVLRLEIEATSPAQKQRVLTTGPLGRPYLLIFQSKPPLLRLSLILQNRILPPIQSTFFCKIACRMLPPNSYSPSYSQNSVQS